MPVKNLSVEEKLQAAEARVFSYSRQIEDLRHELQAERNKLEIAVKVLDSLISGPSMSLDKISREMAINALTEIDEYPYSELADDFFKGSSNL